MKSFTAAAILSMLALSGTSLAMPKQQTNQNDSYKDMFRHPTCHNGEGSFVQQECQRMCLVPQPGEIPHSNPVASAAGPKPTPGACNAVQVPIKQDITMTYDVHVPGATGKAAHKQTSTVIKAAPTAAFYLCSGCTDGKQEQHSGNHKRVPYPVPS